LLRKAPPQVCAFDVFFSFISFVASPEPFSLPFEIGMLMDLASEIFDVTNPIVKVYEQSTN